jgi:hypothetical protein
MTISRKSRPSKKSIAKFRKLKEERRQKWHKEQEKLFKEREVELKNEKTWRMYLEDNNKKSNEQTVELIKGNKYLNNLVQYKEATNDFLRNRNEKLERYLYKEREERKKEINEKDEKIKMLEREVEWRRSGLKNC